MASPDLIVIPARYASTRLPGKPLRPIAGRTMLERVLANGHHAAQLAGNCELVVATDDERIADHARALGAEVAMTEPALDSGSARAHAAALQRDHKPERVICLQGDAPFISGEIVAGLLARLREGSAQVATPVYQLDWSRLDRLREHKLTAPLVVRPACAMARARRCGSPRPSCPRCAMRPNCANSRFHPCGSTSGFMPIRWRRSSGS